MEPQQSARPRPDWLTDPCPPWCCGDHDDQEHPIDRAHLGTMTTIPVIERVRTNHHQSGEVTVHAEPVEATVVIVQAVGDEDVWVAVGTETQQLEVTLESARRLHHYLTSLLRTLE